MKRAVLGLLLMLFPLFLFAQEKRLVVRSYGPSNAGDARAWTSNVTDKNNRVTALIEITFPGQDSLLFEGIIGKPIHDFAGIWMVHVPEGTKSFKIAIAGCKPLNYTFPEALIPESGVTYLMDLSLESLTKLRTLILPSFSYNSAQTAWGIMVGVCKKNGAFLHAKTNHTYGLNPETTCDADGMVDGGKAWFTGESQTSRWAFTAGYMRQLFNRVHSSLYIYAGGGYGARILAWRMYGTDGNYTYARVSPVSYEGLEAEAGLIYRFHWLAFSAGVQTNQFKYAEANMGIGVMF